PPFGADVSDVAFARREEAFNFAPRQSVLVFRVVVAVHHVPPLSIAFRSSSAHAMASARGVRVGSSRGGNVRAAKNSSFFRNCASTPYVPPWSRSSQRHREWSRSR